MTHGYHHMAKSLNINDIACEHHSACCKSPVQICSGTPDFQHSMYGACIVQTTWFVCTACSQDCDVEANE
jgi:hypothetical protein